MPGGKGLWREVRRTTCCRFVRNKPGSEDSSALQSAYIAAMLRCHGDRRYFSPTSRRREESGVNRGGGPNVQHTGFSKANNRWRSTCPRLPVDLKHNLDFTAVGLAVHALGTEKRLNISEYLMFMDELIHAGNPVGAKIRTASCW